jgi:2-C-methyl-D-erythritol 2,4-cyclodiphosphate synthase
VAKLLGVQSDCVGLKAKTPEGLSLENTAVAHVVVLLESAGKISASRKTRKKPGTRGKKR